MVEDVVVVTPVAKLKFVVVDAVVVVPEELVLEDVVVVTPVIKERLTPENN